MSIITNGWNNISQYLNKRYADTPPTNLIAGTATITLGSVGLYNLWFEHKYGDGVEGLKKRVVQTATKLPMVKDRLAKEKAQAKENLRSDYKRYDGETVRVTLPTSGMTVDEVKSEAKEINDKLGGVEWESGRATGAVYHGGDELSDMLMDVCREFIWSNPLHADMFPGIKKMEAEVIAMTLSMFNGPAQACGCMTSGGTESILMAMRAYKERAAQHGNHRPNIICSVSAHAAFDKAGNYFGITVKKIPMDKATGIVDVKAMERAINSKTVCLIGSAPQYGYGVADDIEAIARIAKKHGVGCHVDCCLGGFILPFMADAGYPHPPFDFRVPGVTTISVDNHKYGFAPKGCSCVLYSDQDLRHYQYYSNPHWPGGIYATPTMAGSRNGSIVAGCWAAMIYMGREGYIKTTKDIVETTLKLKKAIGQIPGLKILGDPKSCVVAFGSDEFDPLILADKMHVKGWALSRLQFPSGVHLSVTRLHTEPGIAEEFVRDLKEGAAELMKLPKQPPTGSAAMYGSAQSYPASIVSELTDAFFDVYYEPTFPDEHITTEGKVQKAT